MAFRSRRHIFHAVINNLHRLAGLHRQKRGVTGDHRRIILLASESAASFHLHDSNFFCRKTAQGHERFVNVIGALQRTPHRDSLLGIIRGDHSIVLYVELLLRARPVFAFDNVIGLRPHFVDIALFDQISLEDIVRAPDNFSAALAFFNRVYRGQSIVFNRYRFNRFSKKMAIGVCQQQNRFFRMIDKLTRQAGLIVFDQRDAVLPWNIFAGDNHKFVPGDFRPIRNRPDSAARNLAAHRRPVKHAGQGHVVNVPGLAGNLVAAFLARDRRADDALIAHVQIQRGIVYARLGPARCGVLKIGNRKYI